MIQATRFLRVTFSTGLAFVAVAPTLVAQLPPPTAPAENPITEEKRVLGKALFWDEQLSSDNSTACGTCHSMAQAGSDIRLGRHPGMDGVLRSPDDVIGSPGIVRLDPNLHFKPDPLFGLERQVTGRSAPSILMSAYATELFLDGRAAGLFLDPQTGARSIATGGALESQSVGPILNEVEMGHEGRSWDDVIDKLTRSHPLALAVDIPADVEAAITANPTYPDLFQAAFGDATLTAERIAFALATYQRTLIPDQAPWDRFMAGDITAMTPDQQAGWNALNQSLCVVCHQPPTFADNGYANLGLRPWQEDSGRQQVTGQFDDRGKFRVISLRNVGLKPRFMHNGGLATLEDVIDFYFEENGHTQFTDNRETIMPLLSLDPADRPKVIEFMRNALTDPRVASESFPFDRPTLHSEKFPTNPTPIGVGTPGSGGFLPELMAECPPHLGNQEFLIGVRKALGSAMAFLVIWPGAPPPNRYIWAIRRLRPVMIGPLMLKGLGIGGGFATVRLNVPSNPAHLGTERYLQWLIADPGARKGIAATALARISLF